MYGDLDSMRDCVISTIKVNKGNCEALSTKVKKAALTPLEIKLTIDRLLAVCFRVGLRRRNYET